MFLTTQLPYANEERTSLYRGINWAESTTKDILKLYNYSSGVSVSAVNSVMLLVDFLSPICRRPEQFIKINNDF
jgi:hypothetical protein